MKKWFVFFVVGLLAGSEVSYAAPTKRLVQGLKRGACLGAAHFVALRCFVPKEPSSEERAGAARDFVTSTMTGLSYVCLASRVPPVMGMGSGFALMSAWGQGLSIQDWADRRPQAQESNLPQTLSEGHFEDWAITCSHLDERGQGSEPGISDSSQENSPIVMDWCFDASICDDDISQ